MSNKDHIKVTGTISDCLPGTLFKIKLENGKEIICHLSGRMRVNCIRLIPGDVVDVEMSPYDLTKGRITFRQK
jgi:translation initiation factor IF-1